MPVKKETQKQNPEKLSALRGLRFTFGFCVFQDYSGFLPRTIESVPFWKRSNVLMIDSI